MNTVTIDAVIDVVCPWCYLGKARLDRAISALEGDVEVVVQWRPFELDSTIPPEGVDNQAMLAEKLGSPIRRDEMHEQLTNLGREEGITFNFDRILIRPNTLDAHRLLLWAHTESIAMQNVVVDRLYKANFEEGRNLGDHAVLADIAAECGMDREMVARLLASDADIDMVRNEIANAEQMGVSGVPFFILNQKYALSGAQPAEVLQNALQQLASGDVGNGNGAA
ncbi:DsbA family oxidoreductase [Martelella lutilitoris]|uniref:DsbA family oxidoreductase n=1 Tax=Martelella lutilitoris TaxID=2583532 RepID=A0A5C4JP15_9HYPH|nr:DsbA family oxidoreductase [Martelella lutilitoris]TNB47223.1 DsbA family oxidoreductase [Martelella lutilitoris]